MNVGAVGDSASDWRPGLAEVAGFKNVGLEIIEPVGVNGGVGGPRFEPRWFDQADHGPFGKTFGSHVGPSFSIVTRKLDQAIVGAHPDHTSLLRGFRDSEDQTIELNTGLVFRDGAAR